MITQTEAKLVKYEVMGDFPTAIWLNHFGAHCGYLGVPKSHPWFGKDYNDLDVEVHGGLTYANGAPDFPYATGLEIWWVGFDCGHFMDYMPGMPSGGDEDPSAFKDEAYVRTEIEGLARQAAEASQKGEQSLETGKE